MVIGAVVALLLHAGLAGFGEWFRPHTAKVVKPPEEKSIQLKMPPIEPDEPEIKDPEDAAAPVADFSPPMQVDLPQIMPVDAFVQEIQPPPPEGVSPVTGLINIPQGQLHAGAGLGQIFDLSQLDQVPTATVQGKPLYPFAMRRAGITATVTVEFIVEKTGTVRDAFAVNSTQREFEVEAVRAVTNWKFKPGMRGGVPVPTRMRVEIAFSLNDD